MLFDEADKSLHVELMDLVARVQREMKEEHSPTEREEWFAVHAMLEMVGHIVHAIPDNEHGREFTEWLAEQHPYEVAE